MVRCVRRFVSVFPLVLFLAAFAAAQGVPQPIPSPPPSQPPNPSPQITPDPYGSTRRIVTNRSLSERFDIMADPGRSQMDQVFLRRIYQSHIASLYRKPTDSEMEAMAPDPLDVAANAGFLKLQDTGIVKLMPTAGCSADTKVIDVRDVCMKYTAPGHGASYSFRARTYRIPRLADLTLVDGVLHSTGILEHTVIANIGDVRLEDISANTQGFGFLKRFEPAFDIPSADEKERALNEGIKSDGFVYRRNSEAAVNSTYLMRVIAYRATAYRAVQGVVYDEFGFDKRRDLIVAFRVIRKEDGAVTLLWRTLDEKPAPKMKFE